MSKYDRVCNGVVAALAYGLVAFIAYCLLDYLFDFYSAREMRLQIWASMSTAFIVTFAEGGHE